MAKLTVDDVKRVAKLAKLVLDDREITKFQTQLSKVIDYIAELNEIDTVGVESTSQITGLNNVFREDKLNLFQTLPVDKALNQGKKIHNNYFVTPAVLDHDL